MGQLYQIFKTTLNWQLHILMQMLTYLHIRDFITVKSIELDFNAGMTVITGESGSGKSLLPSALSLISGGRGEADLIKLGADSAEVVTAFNLSRQPTVKEWLLTHHLANDDECLLRRTLSRDGRSKAFINGTLVAVRQLKEIAGMLLNLHQQQAHSSLLGRADQLKILDTFSEQQSLRAEVGHLYEDIAKVSEQLRSQNPEIAQNQDRLSLLDYQIDELETADIKADEANQLEVEYNQLANVENLRTTLHLALDALSEQQDSAINQTQHHLKQLQEIQADIPELSLTCDLLNTGLINLLEAEAELKRHSKAIQEDPERLEYTEKRLSDLHDLARKYKVSRYELHDLQSDLKKQKQQLEQDKIDLQSLEARKEQLKADYQKQSLKLRSERIAAAQKLSSEINAWLADVGMPNSRFEIQIEEDEATVTGTEYAVFMLSGFKGHPLRPIAKIASGGELSRLSLVIHLAYRVRASKVGEVLSTMVLDEADVGIGGHVATKIGLLLRRLADQSQVLVVTHLPQIAVFGQHHLYVEKQPEVCDNLISFRPLTEDDRKAEVARMLAGSDLTKRNLAHASEMLQKAALSK